MQCLRPWLFTLALMVATLAGIGILLVAVVVLSLTISAHEADDHIAAMGQLINARVVPGTTVTHVRVFL